MPTVNKKKPAKKTVAKKTSVKKNSSSKKLVAERSWVPRQSSFAQILQRVGLAGGVGIGLVLMIGFVMLWASGVFGRLGEEIANDTRTRIANMAIGAGFEVRQVRIIGRDRTSFADITNALGPVNGTSILHFNPDSARARIEELGWVRSAAVSRLWPNDINISIRERQPAALWQVNGAFRLVDQVGAVIREAGSFEYPGLPYIVGAGAPEVASEILQVLDEVNIFDTRIAAIMRVSNRRWTLRLNSQQGATMDIKLPEVEFQDALRDLAVLHEAVSVLDRDFEYIDLRDPERAFFLCRGAKDQKGPPLNVLSGDFSCAGTSA